MIEALLVGWGLLAGLDRARVLLLVAALTVPVPLGCLLGVHVWRSRSRPSTRSTLFCEAVSGELRSGASFRSALERAAESVGALGLARLCGAGAPASVLANAVRAEFGEVGEEAATVIEHGSRMGGPVAPLFDEMAALALARIEVLHEVASATAPARATSVVLLAAPLLAVVWAFSSGRLSSYLATPSQRASALLGLGLVAVGIVLAGALLRRAR